MTKKLHPKETCGKLEVSHDKNMGSEARHTSPKANEAPFSGWFSGSCALGGDFRTAVPSAKGCFCFCDTPYIKAASPRADDAGDMAGIAKQERPMPPYNSSDPRISKALTYLHRIQTYYLSPHARLWDTWVDYSVGERTVIEVTTRNLNICKAIRYAVRVLGGKVTLPKVERRVFMRDNELERVKVLVFRFMFK